MIGPTNANTSTPQSITLSQLTEGNIIMLNENSIKIPYIYLGLDESGNALLLREAVYERRQMNSSNITDYETSTIDTWLNNTFLTVFDANTQAALVATPIKVKNFSTGVISEINRKCFLLSYTQLGFDNTGSEGESILPALKTFYDTNDDRTARLERSNRYWLRSAQSGSKYYVSNEDGNAGNDDAVNNNNYIRPVLAFNPKTIVTTGIYEL